MTVVEPMKRLTDGRRIAVLRQGSHTVGVEWRPVCSDLLTGSTVRVEIASRRRGAELRGSVVAGDMSVDVAVQDQGRERIRRSYLAPRLKDVDLLERAVEDSVVDPVAGDTLAMAGRLIAAERHGTAERQGTAEKRRSQGDE
jgi:hypothetical protein